MAGGRIICLLGVAAIAMTACSSKLSSEWTATAPVEEVLKKVRDDERWLWKARSVLIETEGKWTKTKAGIENRAAELRQQFPDSDFKDPKVRKTSKIFGPRSMKKSFGLGMKSGSRNFVI